VQRDALEFLELVDVTTDGITVVGSGSAIVTTAPRYDPGARYELAGATATAATADANGRLRIPVDLGPSHTSEQYSPAARPLQDLPGYFTRQPVTITRAHPAIVPSGPEPGAPPAVEEGSRTRLPATGGVSPLLPALLAGVGASALVAVRRRVNQRA
jgi:hypothetical protein